MTELHPALFLIGGGLLLAFVPLGLRRVLLLALPVAGFVAVYNLEPGASLSINLAGLQLQLLRVDKLSLLFGYLFHAAALVAGIYALHLDDRVQHMTGFLYAGSAVGAVFAGDVLTLFIFWELLAVTSVFQIYARQTPRAIGAGTRYLFVHVISGLLLLAGAAWQYHHSGSLAFAHMELDSPAAFLLFFGFGIKCAFPLFHTWLVDAYPEATPTGTVFLSSFTTKTAIYALARGFAGTEELIWIGAAMAIFPIFYAVIENDLRRVLGYSMINQVGFMVVGVGLGEGMGVNGAVAHAFNDVFFKGLLFMAMGAVLFRTGRMNGSDLGGLYKSMPLTCAFSIVGASSISAFPLFSGFVSKSMVMVEAANQEYLIVWLILLFASAGVFHHAGIKIPFFTFFAHDSGIRCREAPLNMLIAMGVSAVACVFIGIFPSYLYGLLPYAVDYVPYTVDHVVTQLQVLFFSALAFVFLQLTRIYPPELPSVNLDSDWVPRRLLPVTGRYMAAWTVPLLAMLQRLVSSLRGGTAYALHALHGPQGLWNRTWTTTSSVFLSLLFLTGYLLFYY
ncbi:MAG: Na(+)/H(+) antiporter subunit D [Candidatus Latescibacteria bacterium]|nr:Na(+)/H(+) antiporter subunit D [Candidatus Latescibacterota bacterium]